MGQTWMCGHEHPGSSRTQNTRFRSKGRRSHFLKLTRPSAQRRDSPRPHRSRHLQRCAYPRPIEWPRCRRGRARWSSSPYSSEHPCPPASYPHTSCRRRMAATTAAATEAAVVRQRGSGRQGRDRLTRTRGSTAAFPHLPTMHHRAGSRLPGIPAHTSRIAVKISCL